MKTLKDINLCTHPDPGGCFYHIYLLYKAQGATMQLPGGYPAPACDHCKWLKRDEDFHAPMD
ncbi:MAG: hypothetical protein WC444_06255 [Candidatus Paceibacterota bacterium]